MKKRKKFVRWRHSFYRAIFHLPIFLLAKFKGYKTLEHFKIGKNENYIIVSNHQTDFDGVFVPLAFNKMPYILATDSIFSKKFVGNFISHCFGVISKKKGTLDINSNMEMMRVIKEGGSLLFFPEGNRTYAEFQYSMTQGFTKFMRFLKRPIICYSIHGGTGSLPRWGKKQRKGKFYGKISRIISVEEISKMSDEELEKLILESIRVYDSDTNELYKSKAKAEYLERMLFVCPKCGKVQTLVSSGDHLKCSSCGLDVEYTENLHLKSEDPEFKFTKLIDWYNYQITFLKNNEFDDNAPIFKDESVKLFLTNGKKRRPLSKGQIILYKDKMVFENNLEIPVQNISNASPISGCKFNFSIEGNNYLVKGHDRFNPLKYVLMFNKLDTLMNRNSSDIYYPLKER